MNHRYGLKESKIIMRKKDVKIGMIVYAFTSAWGEYLIQVTEITNDIPARVHGNIIKRLKKGDGFRKDRILTELDVGIISVKIPTPEQLAFAGV